MQTYLAGLEPAPVVRDKRHGSVLEGWRVSAVCEAPIERKARRLDKAADVLDIWNEHVVRHPAYSPDQEAFVVFCVNTQTRLLGWQLITLGTVSSCLCHPREVFRAAIVAAASGVVCAHNHPSGDPAPSSADLNITRQLREASKVLGITLVDHVVVGRPAVDPNGRGWYSFREAGLV